MDLAIWNIAGHLCGLFKLYRSRGPKNMDELKESVSESVEKVKESASESINEAKESTRKIVEEKVDEKIEEILGD